MMVGEVFAECDEGTGFPDFEFSRLVETGAWRSQ
jgi:hypothetical protein